MCFVSMKVGTKATYEKDYVCRDECVDDRGARISDATPRVSVCVCVRAPALTSEKRREDTKGREKKRKMGATK
jgi:hypothetical protein